MEAPMNAFGACLMRLAVTPDHSFRGSWLRRPYPSTNSRCQRLTVSLPFGFQDKIARPRCHFTPM